LLALAGELVNEPPLVTTTVATFPLFPHSFLGTDVAFEVTLAPFAMVTLPGPVPAAPLAILRLLGAENTIVPGGIDGETAPEAEICA
jgi:hypothetical protein